MSETSVLITDYDPRYIKMCYFVTLGELGYSTRVTLANGLPSAGLPAEPYHVSLEAFNVDGGRLGMIDSFAVIEPGGFLRVDVADHIGPGQTIPDSGRDVLGIFHLVPDRYFGRPAVDVEIGEIFRYVSTSDEYIEYHSDRWEVAGGLAYQSTPINDPRFGGTRTTLMQSPKMLVDECLDTQLLLFNVSTSPTYEQAVNFDLALLNTKGSVVARHNLTIPPYGFRRVSLRDVLKEAGAFDEFVAAGGSGLVVGFSDLGSVVPLSLTRQDESKGLAMDHTLPPQYYLPWWGGEVRKAANARLRARLFPDRQSA